MLWCGEVLPTPTLIYWMKRLPHVQFTNLYGPTETTIASSYYTVPACPGDPAGGDSDRRRVRRRRAARARRRRCDRCHRERSATCYIGGVGLSPGYWRDPDRTDAVFVADPRASRPSRIYKTGDLATARRRRPGLLPGRADSQIKSRGYRIELGEIEAAVNACPGMRGRRGRRASTTGGFEGSAICCAYVPGAAEPTLTPVTVRRELSRLLPSYMLPARWMPFEQFPRNANGKIDRPRLKQAFEADAAQAG